MSRNAWFAALQKRLPGGILFSNLFPKAWEFRYGFRVTMLRFAHGMAIYCFGCRFAGKNRPVGKLMRPSTALFHFTPESNQNSILMQGILPIHDDVYLTDWTDAEWCARLKNPDNDEALICFRIDAESLVAQGHPIALMNCFHEFTTDRVPPDCLSLTSIRFDWERKQENKRNRA